MRLIPREDLKRHRASLQDVGGWTGSGGRLGRSTEMGEPGGLGCANMSGPPTDPPGLSQPGPPP